MHVTLFSFTVDYRRQPQRGQQPWETGGPAAGTVLGRERGAEGVEEVDRCGAWGTMATVWTAWCSGRRGDGLFSTSRGEPAMKRPLVVVWHSYLHDSFMHKVLCSIIGNGISSLIIRQVVW